MKGVSAWVVRMLKMFGLGPGNESEELTWGDDSQLQGAAMFNVSDND